MALRTHTGIFRSNLANPCSVGWGFIRGYMSDRGLSCSALTGATELTRESGKCQSSAALHTHTFLKGLISHNKCKHLRGFVAFLYQHEAINSNATVLKASYNSTTPILEDIVPAPTVLCLPLSLCDEHNFQ